MNDPSPLNEVIEAGVREFEAALSPQKQSEGLIGNIEFTQVGWFALERELRTFASKIAEAAREESPLYVAKENGDVERVRDVDGFKAGAEAERAKHHKRLEYLLNLHSRPATEGGLDYVKAFEAIEDYEMELSRSLIQDV
jgi:hypothetical protein